VIDTMNYCRRRRRQELFEDPERGSSEVVQRRLARSTLVKTPQPHRVQRARGTDADPPGSAERRGARVASDDAGAVDVVADVIERIGYDAVRLESLAGRPRPRTRRPVFGASFVARPVRASHSRG